MSEEQSSYTCAHCLGTFEKGWSDEKAIAEATSDFPNEKIESMAVVCDDCYREIMGLNAVKQ